MLHSGWSEHVELLVGFPFPACGYFRVAGHDFGSAPHISDASGWIHRGMLPFDLPPLISIPATTSRLSIGQEPIVAPKHKGRGGRIPGGTSSRDRAVCLLAGRGGRSQISFRGRTIRHRPSGTMASQPDATTVPSRTFYRTCDGSADRRIQGPAPAEQDTD